MIKLIQVDGTLALKLNTSKANEILKWSPKITFDDSINLISEWFLHWLEERNAEKITNDQIDFFLTKDKKIV